MKHAIFAILFFSLLSSNVFAQSTDRSADIAENNSIKSEEASDSSDLPTAPERSPESVTEPRTDSSPDTVPLAQPGRLVSTLPPDSSSDTGSPFPLESSANPNSTLLPDVSADLAPPLLLENLSELKPALSPDTSADSGRKLNTEKMIESQGATFYTTKGGDLNVLLERKHPKNAEGQFDIIVEKLPKESVTLSVSSYDLDEERGETHTISLNGQKVGTLSGTNDQWNTTVLEIPKDLVKLGPNTVSLVISDSSKTGTINWSGKLGWGQLLIDGGAADKGQQMSALKLAFFEERKQVQTTSAVFAKVAGEFRLETTILDEKNNAMDAKIEEFKLEADVLANKEHLLQFDQKLPTGTYRAVANLFFFQDGIWIQQDTQNVSFKHVISSVKIKYDPNAVKPIVLTEDFDPTSIDIKGVFSLEGVTEAEPEDLKIELRLVPKPEPDVVQTDLSDLQLQLTAIPNRFGETSATVIAQLGVKQMQHDFPITIQAVDDAPTIVTPVSDQMMHLGEAPLDIDLATLFADIDSDLDKVPYQATVSDPNLISATITGRKLEITPAGELTGTSTVVIKADVDGKLIQDEFQVIVKPRDEPRVNAPLEDIQTDEDSELDAIDLETLFTDDAVDDSSIEITIGNIDNPSLLEATIDDRELIITLKKDQNGEGQITLVGRSRGMKVESQLKILVAPVDDPPYVKSPPELVKLVYGENESETVDLRELFADVDNSPEEIQISLVDNNRPEHLLASLAGKQLNLELGSGDNGYVTLELEADSGGQSVTYDYRVEVDFGEPIEPYVYGFTGVETVQDYDLKPALGIGAGITLERFLPGLKVEIEVTQGLGHQRRGTTGGEPYTTELDHRMVALFAGYNIETPLWLFEYVPWLEGFEINVRGGSALVIQTLTSIPDNPDRATANAPKTQTVTTSAKGGGLAYHFNTDLVLDIGLTIYGADITLAHAGLRYHF